MNFYKNFLFSLILTVAAPIHAASLADQAVALPLESKINGLAFVLGGALLGATQINGVSVLPIGGWAGILIALSNSTTLPILELLKKQSYIHPAWGYALAPAILLSLPIKIGFDNFRDRNKKKTNPLSARIVDFSFIPMLFTQSALASPVLGLAAIGLVDVVKSLAKQ